MNKKRSRHNGILQSLDTLDVVPVEKLAAEFGLSEATIRRDLEELEQAGRIVRTRGGARLLRGLPEIAKKFEERGRLRLAEKSRVVAEAEKHIPPGSVVALDNGTTSWLLAKRLKTGKGITVATNSLPIVEELGIDLETQLLVSGGIFRARNLDLIGPRAVEFFADLAPDIAVVTCDAYKPGQGLYKLSDASADIARAMVAAAKRVFVIADHTKIGAPGSYRFLKPAEIELFFVDSAAPEETRKLLKGEPFKTFYC